MTGRFTLATLFIGVMIQMDQSFVTADVCQDTVGKFFLPDGIRRGRWCNSLRKNELPADACTSAEYNLQDYCFKTCDTCTASPSTVPSVSLATTDSPTKSPTDSLTTASPTKSPTVAAPVSTGEICQDAVGRFVLPGFEGQGRRKWCKSLRNGELPADACTSDYNLQDYCFKTCDTCTASPSTVPSDSPTMSPTMSPTASPTMSPTASPTMSPTDSPTMSPTMSPTASPTGSPTMSPTMSPTASPTGSPTASPSVFPSMLPSMLPSLSPSEEYTLISVKQDLAAIQDDIDGLKSDMNLVLTVVEALKDIIEDEYGASTFSYGSYGASSFSFGASSFSYGSYGASSFSYGSYGASSFSYSSSYGASSFSLPYSYSYSYSYGSYVY